MKITVRMKLISKKVYLKDLFNNSRGNHLLHCKFPVLRALHPGDLILPGLSEVSFKSD